MKFQILKLVFISLLINISIQIDFSTYSSFLQQVQTKKNDISIGIVTSSSYLCQRCDRAEEPIEAFLENAQGLLNIHVLDCEKEKKGPHYSKIEPICSDGMRLPHITFFEQQSDDSSKSWPKDTLYTGPVDSDHFLDFAQNLSHSSVKIIENLRSLRNFVDNRLSTNMKFLFFSEEERTPLVMKILSLQNRETISFAQLDSDNDKLVKKYPGIKSTRGIVFLTWDKFEQVYREQYFENVDNLDLTSYKAYKTLQNFIKQQVSESQKIMKQSSQKKNSSLLDIKNLKISQFGNEQLNNEDQWVLYHLHETNKEHQRFSEIKQNYGAFFQYFESELTCQNCKKIAKETFGISTFPIMIAYPQGKKQIDKFIKIEDADDFEELNKTFLDYIHATEKVLYTDDDEQNIRLFKDILDEGRLPVVWLYDSYNTQQKLFMHTLTYMNKYKKTIRFFRYSNPTNDIKEQWQEYQSGAPSQLPQLYNVMKVNQKSIEKASGMNEEEKTFYNYLIYLDGIVDNQYQQVLKQSSLMDVTNADTWDKECRSSSQPCVVAMLSVHREGKFQREKELYEQLKENFPKKQVKWVWMDGYCREEILKAVQLTTADLPTLIYYDNTKGKYKTMQEKWGQKNNEAFIQSIRRKTSKYQNIKNELEIGTQYKDCKDFNVQQKVIYEAVKQKKREMAIEKERQNKAVYDSLPKDYDEIEDDDDRDQYGMKRPYPKKDKEDL